MRLILKVLIYIAPKGLAKKNWSKLNLNGLKDFMDNLVSYNAKLYRLNDAASDSVRRDQF